jgi:hypothetical protein
MADPIDFGTDIRTSFQDGVCDIDPSGAIDTPAHALAMAIARRFLVERGQLFYDESYGLDLRLFLAKGMRPAQLFQLRFLIASEAEKDERISSASADVQFRHADQALLVRLECTSGLGPFSLTLGVTSLTVALLSLDVLRGHLAD